MPARDKEDRGSPPGELASPFLDEELFAQEADPEWEAHLSMLEAESPFRHAFTRRRGRAVQPQAYRRAGETERESLEDGAREYFLEPEEEFPDTPTPDKPGTYRGGKLAEFAAATPVRIGVFVPKAASTADEVDVLVFIHGHLWVCEPAPKTPQAPSDLITGDVFALGRIVDESQRAVVLAVPFFDWRKRAQPPLGDPAKLNQFVAEVLTAVGRMRGTGAPTLRSLILAGHSRAHSILNPLAKAHASPEMTRGALSRLAEVWALDTTYTSPTSAYQAWFNAKPGVAFRVFYRAWTWNKQRERVPADTKAGGEKFVALARQLARKSPGRFQVMVVKEGHCSVPRTRLPGLLAAAASTASGAPKPSAELEFEDERESATEHRHEDWPEGEEGQEHWLDAEREEHEHWQEGQEDERESWREEAEGESPYAEGEYEHSLEDFTAFEDEGFTTGDDWSEAEEEAEDQGPAEALEFEAESPWSDGSGTDSGWSAEGALFEGPEGALLDDYLQYLEELVDEEVFDEEVGSAEQEWQAHPAIHGHFNGKTPQQRFALYLELRPLYQQATGASNPAKWITDNIVSLTFLGRRTPAHRDLRAPLAAAEAQLQRRGTRPALSSFWGFVPRKMRTRNRLSNHALGRAVDIDPKTNPHIYSKDEILVIREATGVDLGQPQTHDAMRRASQGFRQTFNPGWVSQQTKAVQDAARRSRTALDRYARDGFLNLEQALIDALLGAGFTWGGDWKSEKDFMHFELPVGRRPVSAADSGAARPAVAAAGATADRVRFAQRVLNAAEGEKLRVDADLGPLTRGALDRFRRKHGLGTGGVLDEKTEVALVQRALEELAQQSLFPIGVRDAATDQAVAGFKAKRGLGSGASLDDATRRALTDALDQRRGAAADTGAAPHRPTGVTAGAVPSAGVSIRGGSWGGWVGRQTQGTESAKISRNQIRDKYDMAVAVAAQVETGGYYDKVQMYDRGILSWGIKQWTLHRGSLQQLLGFIKARLEPSLWDQLFPGIDIQGTRLVVNGNSLQVPREDDDPAGLALRRSFRGSEDPKKLNTSIMDNWLSVFALAARNPSVQQLQLEYAAKSLKDNLNKHLGRTLKARKDVKQIEVQNYRRVGDYIEGSSLALALFNSMETQNPKWTYIYLKRVVDRLAGRHGGYDVKRWPPGWQEMFVRELTKEFSESGFACWGARAVATKPACKGRTSRTDRTLQAYQQISS
jgi:hypothetical protein